jgi:hypothetical protein
MQTELEKWIEENKVMAHIFNEHGEHMVPLNALRALLAGKVLCNAEPIGYLYQHEDTGMTTSVDVQQVEWGFEKNNPRFTLIGPLHKPADILPQGEAGKEGGE